MLRVILGPPEDWRDLPLTGGVASSARSTSAYARPVAKYVSAVLSAHLSFSCAFPVSALPNSALLCVMMRWATKLEDVGSSLGHDEQEPTANSLSCRIYGLASSPPHHGQGYLLKLALGRIATQIKQHAI